MDMDGFIGTKAERQWLATLKRIADALERLANTLEGGEEGE